MTESSTPPAEVSRRRKPASPPPSYGAGRGLLVFIFRLLMLGVSGTLAGLLGIAIANLYPGNIQEPPLAEKVLQGSRSLWQGITRLPQSWQTPNAPSGTAPTLGNPSPDNNLETQPETTLPTPPTTDSDPQTGSPLSDTDRQQVQTELSQIQTELQQLNSRAAELETRVGATNAGSLEERLQGIERQLDPNAAPPSPAPSFTENQSFIAPTTTRSTGGELLTITLPSDALFSPDQTTLRPETTEIFNTIAADLQRYPGAAIRVIGHTDSQGSSANDRARSFEQASAVAQALSQSLDDSYRWIVAGAGSNRPLVENTTLINRQRNRRIEIVIDPK
jgi:OOP family OmpA-OmpF porin